MLLAREAENEARSKKSTDLVSSWHSGGRNRRHLKPPSTDSSASRCQHLSYPTNRFPLLRQSFSHHAISRTPNSTTVGLETKMIGDFHEQNPQMGLTNQECSATKMHCYRHCIPILMILLTLGNIALAQFCRLSSYFIHTLRWGFYNFDYACVVHFD
jgi:hypothetical protein